MCYNGSMKTNDILNLMIETERKASKIMLEAENIIASSKTDARNVVTRFDTAVQEMLVSAYSKACPGAHFFCEESAHPDSLNAAQTFIIDPIDGTMNFVHGLRHSCISSAYAENGEVCAAAVYNPYSDEMYTAVKGGGAFLNGRKISVDNCGLEGGFVCVGTAPYYADTRDELFSLMRKLYDASLDIRRGGSAELDLCTVAAGRACFYFEPRLSLWDYAAGALIAAEAGAVCLDLKGRQLPYDESKPGIICGGEKAIKEYLSL